jgi:hypothetical protein
MNLRELLGVAEEGTFHLAGRQASHNASHNSEEWIRFLEEKMGKGIQPSHSDLNCFRTYVPLI